MDTLPLVFLGIIALASLAQGTFLVVMALGAKKVAERVDEMQQRLDKDIRPALDNMTRVSANIAVVSDLAAAQAQRVDEFVGGALFKIDETTTNVKEIARRPLEALEGPIALFKAVRRGVQVYQQLGSLPTQRRNRHYPDDEQLFI